jgi:hypothetical protein
MNDSSHKKTTPKPGVGRRRFLGGVTALAALPLGQAVAGELRPADLLGRSDLASDLASERADRAWRIRTTAADRQLQQTDPVQRSNGDEERYPNRIGSFSKSLPHNALGEVDRSAYQQYLEALRSGRSADFDRIPMGGNGRLTNPQSGLAFELLGGDAASFTQPPPPAFASAEMAAEIGENYWMALTRDVSFTDYESSPLINAAATDLSRFSAFKGPKIGGSTSQGGGQNGGGQNGGGGGGRGNTRGAVTPSTLFRGLTPGDLTGPYISQFLWHDVPYGTETIGRRIRTAQAGDDYLTKFADWLTAQVNTGHQALPNRYDSVARYIRNGRDLAEWAHIDVLFQAYLNAALILGAMKAPVDAGNPYLDTPNQIGFATYGMPHLLNILTAVAGAALRGVWYQKWYVHRRLRPDEFAARIHNRLTRQAGYPVHDEILFSAAPQEVYRRYGTHLLPMAYAEGSPTHPAYGSGHAAVAGACTTILKVWFNEDWVIPNPVVVDRDGLTRGNWLGSSLTVGGELNKLASNVAFGRNIGGVHWRSDAVDSLRFGEAVALSMLGDLSGCYNEDFGGFTLTKFDGERVVIN